MERSVLRGRRFHRQDRSRITLRSSRATRLAANGRMEPPGRRRSPAAVCDPEGMRNRPPELICGIPIRREIDEEIKMFTFKKKLEMPSAPTASRHFVNGRPLKGPYPQGFETAIFGLGCFWGAERKFWELGDGIHITAVGYAGGHTPHPTYEEVCSGRTGHTEVVLAVFDPKKISYERLLKTFW